MNQPPPPNPKNYTPIRLIFGVLKSTGELEGRLAENKIEFDKLILLFEDGYRRFKLVEEK